MTGRELATKAADVGLSIVCSAVAIWLGCGLWNAVFAFIAWRPYHPPTWFEFRMGMVIATGIQILHYRQQRKGA